MYSRVLGTGSALPKRIVTNGEFAAMLARDGIETSDEWIRTRTGIESRHFADEAEGETTSSLAVAAARRALEAANVETSEIDLIIVATTTPDMVFPSVACRVQAALGARGCAAFDVQAVCAGFIYALNAADAMLRRVNKEILAAHLKHCVEHAKDEAERAEKIDELVSALGKML